MDFARFKETLTPLYKTRDVAHRLELAERRVQLAYELAREVTNKNVDPDTDIVCALGYLMGVKEQVLPNMNVRGALEACVAEYGWSTLRARELFRALERLPEHPKSIEEQLVADADTLLQFGLLGLARDLVAAGAVGKPIPDVVERSLKGLSCRLYTAPAHARGNARRDAHREWLLQLKKEWDG